MAVACPNQKPRCREDNGASRYITQPRSQTFASQSTSECRSEGKHKCLNVILYVRTSICDMCSQERCQFADRLGANGFVFNCAPAVCFSYLSFSVTKVKKNPLMSCRLPPPQKKSLLRKLRLEECRAASFCLFSLFIHPDSSRLGYF